MEKKAFQSENENVKDCRALGCDGNHRAWKWVETSERIAEADHVLIGAGGRAFGRGNPQTLVYNEQWVEESV